MNIKLNRKDAKIIIDTAYPDYKGRKISVEIIDNNKEIETTSYWDGGSKTYYTVLNNEGIVIGDSKSYHNFHPAIQESKQPKWIANDNEILVTRNYFCGQDCGIRIYVTPTSNMLPKNLLEIK